MIGDSDPAGVVAGSAEAADGDLDVDALAFLWRILTGTEGLTDEADRALGAELQRNRIGVASGAAAAADALRHDAVGPCAGRTYPARLLDGHVAGEVAAAAESADGDRDMHRPARGRVAGRQQPGNRGAAVAAAAADRLREDAVRRVSIGRDEAGVGHIHRVGRAAGSAEPT